jgi:Protein of unknown function (DUF3667)
LSHLQERKEKTCLNCNAHVYDRFCHICGQENIETKESAWHLISHFFQDITHFDGKFFTSLKYLTLRPGFLSREYMTGRRASHLNPIRMYVFTSAFFFLIFFSLFKVEPSKVTETTVDNGIAKVSVSAMRQMNAGEYRAFVDGLVKSDSTLRFAYDSAKYFKYLDSMVNAGRAGFRFTPTKFKTRQEYDSALANGKDHNWLERQLVYRQFTLKEKYGGNNRAMVSAVMDKLMHSLPQIFFITLPLFALLLKLLYIRRKQFYYVNHAIFTIHLLVFVFIALLITFGIGKLNETLRYNWLSFLNSVIILLIFFYNYKAMRNFYQQGRAKTIAKFLLLHFMNLILVIFVFFAFFMVSLFKA